MDIAVSPSSSSIGKNESHNDAVPEIDNP